MLAKLYQAIREGEDVKSYPVLGVVGRKLFSISAVIGKGLQPLLQRLPAYYCNSNQAIHQFSKIITRLKANSNNAMKYCLVAIDAVSMHTNVLKEEVLENAKELLNEKFMRAAEAFPTNELLEAIEIAFDNNSFTYGDTPWMK